MARKKGRFVKVSKPKVSLTSKGVNVSKPSMRIGRKIGINISSKGISASLRSKLGTLSTRRGRSTGIFKLLEGSGCGVLALFILIGMSLMLVLFL